MFSAIEKPFDLVGQIFLPTVNAVVPFEAVLCGTKLLVAMPISAPAVEAPDKLKLLARAIMASCMQQWPMKIKTVQFAWTGSVLTSVVLD